MFRAPKFVFALILSLLSASAAHAAILVVDPAAATATDANDGSQTHPLRTISHAAALAQPGDVVQIHSGVYREKVTIPQSGTEGKPIRFEAAPNSDVVVTGADPLTGWRREPGAENLFSTAWPYRVVLPDPHLPGGVAQVFVHHELLQWVSSLKEVTGGTFFVDASSKRVYLHASRNPDDNRSDQPVEGSARPVIWGVVGAYVHTRGIHFCCAANRAQQGMAEFLGAHAVVEDCTFEWSNSTGAKFMAEDITVRRCTFHDNGQQGFSAPRAHRLHLDGCTIQRNNVKNYPRGWEAGGNKIALSRGVVCENCRFLGNHGVGLWFDVSNVDSTVRHCLFADNEDAGVFYEISYGLHAYDNVAVGNGLAGTKGSWGADGGICVSSSPGCVIERNLLVGNQQGFCFREQNRTTLPISELDHHTAGKSRAAEVPVWNHDEVIRDNLFVNNRTAQVQGWFDIATDRHWPRAMQTGTVEQRKVRKDAPARPDLVPPGLALEDLKIAFHGNIYAFLPEQPFFVWGANWKRKQKFTDLPDLTRALGFEDKDSRVLPSFTVADVASRDFRLPQDLFSVVERAYPQGSVPDCLLGTR